MKPIEEKEWFEVRADGKTIGVVEDGDKKKTLERQYQGFCGITIVPASQASLIKYNAMTMIPGVMLRRFRNSQPMGTKRK